MRRGTKILLWVTPTAAIAVVALIYASRSLPAYRDLVRAESFTAEENLILEQLRSSNTVIRIGNIPDSPPIDFINETGIRKGLSWDYVNLIEHKLGLRFKRVRCDNWEEDLRNGRVDLVASVQNTPERRREFNFTRPYDSFDMFIFTSKDSGGDMKLDMMNGMQIGAVSDSAVYRYLRQLKETYPRKYSYELVAVSDTSNGLLRTSNGSLHALVADGAVSGWYMAKLTLDLRIAGKVSYAWDLCLASSTSSPLPVTILDKAVGQITSSERRSIAQDWPTLRRTEFDRDLWLRISGGILLLTLLAIGGFLLRNRLLHRQVALHVRELGRVRQSHAQTSLALDESEERFRVLVESSSDMIWEIDRYGSYTYVSPRVYNVLGYKPEELIGKSSLSLMIPTDSARKMEQLRHRKVGSTIECEINTYLHRSGRRVILESSGMAFANNLGELAGFRGVSRDITERIANESALRRSEERFRNLVETTSDWIWEVDTEGRYTYSSPQSADLLGIAPDEMIGRYFTELMPTGEAETMRNLFAESMSEGKPIHSLVNTNRHRKGHHVMLEMSAVPFYDKDWNIQGYRGIERDITERVATERQLAFERNLFRTFMEHAPDLIYFKDADGRFIEVNNAKADELRLPPDKIIGRTDYDFLPEEQARQKFEDEQMVMRTRRPLQKEEMATTLDGNRWYLTTKVPRYDEDGNVVGTFGTSWNITYRKETEEQLRQLRALLSNTIDSMPSILVGVDAQGRIIQWNRRAEMDTGIPAGHAIGLPLRDTFPDLAREMTKVDRAIRERQPQREERVRTEKENRVRYHDTTVFPLIGGEIEGAVIRVDDVTDRVMIEDSIRNIVEGVAAVGRRFFNSMVIQLGKTLDADFTFISEFSDEDRTSMRTIAVSDGGIIGANFDYALHTTPCMRVLEQRTCLHVPDVRAAFPRTEMLSRMEIQDYIAMPLVDSENKALGIMVAMYRNPVEHVEFASSIMQVFAGRTAAELERLQATKELIALRNLLENIINAMPSILIGVDAEGRVMQWNHEAVRVSGLEAAQVHGQPLRRVFPDFGSGMGQLLESLGKRDSQYHERIHCMIMGEPKMADVTIYPLTADGSEGAVIRIDDVTDRVRIEEMMVQSEKMMSVGGLAAGMAHEINNPLAGILQNLQVIRNRIMHDSERNSSAAAKAGTSLDAIRCYMQSRDLVKMLDSASEAGRRAARIVDNMLSFSRKEESNFVPNDLADIIERSIELASNDYNLKKRFDFRHIRIIREFGTMPPIPCEAGQIQQVILNLLSNSAQAMAERREDGPEPCITVRLREERDMALIEVEDNGPGMDPEVRKRVFEPFFTTKEVGHGTGLGLSVSYFIITENHGGTMNVFSTPGHGARFSIRIPYEHRMARWGLRL